MDPRYFFLLLCAFSVCVVAQNYTEIIPAQRQVLLELISNLPEVPVNWTEAWLKSANLCEELVCLNHTTNSKPTFYQIPNVTCDDTGAVTEISFNSYGLSK